MTADYQKTYYQRNKERIKARVKAYTEKNKAKVASASRAYYANHSETIKAKVKARSFTNRDTVRKRSQDYRNRPENRARTREYNRNYKPKNRAKRNAAERARRANDPLYRMKCNMKTRFSQAIANSGKVKSFSITGILRYDRGTLKSHIERQFRDGMTWQNYGLWHVDHIKPLDAFDLGNGQQAAEAWALENLQPLWASENCSKRNRFDKETVVL